MRPRFPLPEYVIQASEQGWVLHSADADEATFTRGDELLVAFLVRDAAGRFYVMRDEVYVSVDAPPQQP